MLTLREHAVVKPTCSQSANVALVKSHCDTEYYPIPMIGAMKSMLVVLRCNFPGGKPCRGDDRLEKADGFGPGRGVQ